MGKTGVSGSKLEMKTYVVLRRVFQRGQERPNVEVLDVKLTLAAAEAIRDQYTGTWIERFVANKHPSLTAKR